MEVNGFLVCGALTPGEESEFTYPKELKDEILTEVPCYKCKIEFGHVNLKRLSSQILQSIENREKLILYLLEKKSWDLFFAVFTETDLAQHKYWAGIDSQHPIHNRFRKEFGTFVYKVYERLDKAIGKIIENIPDETTVFIILLSLTKLEIILYKY